MFYLNSLSLYALDTSKKKENFFHIIIPPINKVYNQLSTQYQQIKLDINQTKNLTRIDKLKKSYRVKTDKELLIALKPQPKSIAIAQAAMESGWGTSRFFKEANNVFGIWCVNKDEPKIAAKEKRDNKTIWLRKFNTIEESIRYYYKTIATNPAYKEFRKLKYKTNNPIKLVTKLDKYSEMKDEYTKQLIQVIKYNHLIKYDTNITKLKQGS